MRLYYLTSEHWAKEILKEKRLKLSVVGELNDPFELLGASIGGKQARRVAQYVHGRLNNTFGLLCMSSTWQSPVMWAHYGDKHKGVCLGFEVPEWGAKEVSYSPARLETVLGKKPALSDITHEVLEALFTTKSAEWSYEQERRLIIRFTDAHSGGNGMYFWPFDGKLLTLREVILGCRCSMQIPEAAKAGGRVSARVSVRRVRPAFQEFRMVQQKQERVVHVEPRA